MRWNWGCLIASCSVVCRGMRAAVGGHRLASGLSARPARRGSGAPDRRSRRARASSEIARAGADAASGRAPPRGRDRAPAPATRLRLRSGSPRPAPWPSPAPARAARRRPGGRAADPGWNRTRTEGATLARARRCQPSRRRTAVAAPGAGRSPAASSSPIAMPSAPIATPTPPGFGGGTAGPAARAFWISPRRPALVAAARSFTAMLGRNTGVGWSAAGTAIAASGLLSCSLRPGASCGPSGPGAAGASAGGSAASTSACPKRPRNQSSNPGASSPSPGRDEPASAGAPRPGRAPARRRSRRACRPRTGRRTARHRRPRRRGAGASGSAACVSGSTGSIGPSGTDRGDHLRRRRRRRQAAQPGAIAHHLVGVAGVLAVGDQTVDDRAALLHAVAQLRPRRHGVQAGIRRGAPPARARRLARPARAPPSTARQSFGNPPVRQGQPGRSRAQRDRGLRPVAPQGACGQRFAGTARSSTRSGALGAGRRPARFGRPISAHVGGLACSHGRTQHIDDSTILLCATLAQSRESIEERLMAKQQETAAREPRADRADPGRDHRQEPAAHARLRRAALRPQRRRQHPRPAQPAADDARAHRAADGRPGGARPGAAHPLAGLSAAVAEHQPAAAGPARGAGRRARARATAASAIRRGTSTPSSTSSSSPIS